MHEFEFKGCVQEVYVDETLIEKFFLGGDLKRHKSQTYVGVSCIRCTMHYRHVAGEGDAWSQGSRRDSSWINTDNIFFMGSPPPHPS